MTKGISIKALELGTQMWQDDWHPTETVTVRVQVSTWCECRCLPGVSAGTYPVWVQVPTRCECRYLPGVSAGTCTYPVRVLVPTRCEYRYLPVVIRAASDQFGGDVAIAVQHWQAVHNKQLTLLYTKQPVHNKQLTLLNTKATCTQETVNPIIYKTIWTQ